MFEISSYVANCSLYMENNVPGCPASIKKDYAEVWTCICVMELSKSWRAISSLARITYEHLAKFSLR